MYTYIDTFYIYKSIRCRMKSKQVCKTSLKYCYLITDTELTLSMLGHFSNFLVSTDFFQNELFQNILVQEH